MSSTRSLASKLVGQALAGLLIAPTGLTLSPGLAFAQSDVVVQSDDQPQAAVAADLTDTPEVQEQAEMSADVDDEDAPTLDATRTGKVRALPSLTTSACPSTLQSQIDAAAAGSTVTPAVCIYRETVTISKPLTLRAAAGTEIRGSNIWTGWMPAGATWVSGASVPTFASETGNPSYVDAFHATHPEQVFMDGRALTEVSSSPAAGQFALDSARHVVLGADPTGHTVEVTVRDKWLLPTSDSVTVSGFVFKHAATAGQGWSIGNNNRSYFTLSNSTISDVHGSAVGLGGGDTYSSILNNTFTRIGDTAVTSYKDGHSIIRGNTIFGNGFGGWDWGWQAGGIKTASSTNLLVDQNVVYGNGGPGIWCDMACQNVTISNNTVHDNTGPNIFFEISVGASIFGNAVWHTTSGWPAIYISSSANAEVFQNIVAWSPRGIQVYEQNRPDKPVQGVVNVYVHDNTIVEGSGSSIAAFWGDYGNGGVTNPASNNHGANNRYWYPIAEDGETRFIWGSSGFSSLSAFANTPAEQSGAYISTTQRDQILSAKGVPLTQ